MAYGNDANSLDKSHRWAYWIRAGCSARPCCRLGRHFSGCFDHTDHDGRCYRANSSKGLERAPGEILTSATISKIFGLMRAASFIGDRLRQGQLSFTTTGMVSDPHHTSLNSVPTALA